MPNDRLSAGNILLLPAIEDYRGNRNLPRRDENRRHTFVIRPDVGVSWYAAQPIIQMGDALPARLLPNPDRASTSIRQPGPPAALGMPKFRLRLCFRWISRTDLDHSF